MWAAVRAGMRFLAAIPIALALAACTDDATLRQELVVGDGGPIGFDALTLDAPWFDAAILDGPVLDASVLDAPVPDAGVAIDARDAAVADAPLDAMLDAPLDAMLDASVDALTDARPDGPPVDAPMGCPVNPSCTDTSPTMISPTNPTGLCRGMCDPACQSDYWRWNFWVTQYNVSGTYGWGEHQGIAIIGHSYRYDDRFAWNAPGAAMPPWRQGGALWAQGMAVSVARQFEMRTTNPSGESTANVPVSQSTQPATRFAYCSHARLIDTPIYDHGRALARIVPTDTYYASRNLIPMRLLSTTDQCRNRNGGWCRSATTQHPTQIGTCMATITDGACDSRCGNCSYVAITPTAQGGSVAYWEDVNVPAPRAGLTVRGARNEPTARVEYVGGVTAGAVDRPFVNFWGRNLLGRWVVTSTRRVDAPFTHCFDTTAGFVAGTHNPMEWVLDSSPDTLTGRWGHNSNTDAEMALTLFNGCGATPTVTSTPAGVHAACGVCGTPVLVGGATTQYPCRARTDTAALWWTRTSGIHNIDDWAPGVWPGFAGNPNTATNPSWQAAARPIPTCAWGGFRVWGM